MGVRAKLTSWACDFMCLHVRMFACVSCIWAGRQRLGGSARVNRKPPCPAEVLIQPPVRERCRLIDKGGLSEGQSDTALAVFASLSDTCLD